MQPPAACAGLAGATSTAVAATSARATNLFRYLRTTGNFLSTRVDVCPRSRVVAGRAGREVPLPVAFDGTVVRPLVVTPVEDVGFWVPPAGPARQRFSSQLLAVER